MKTFSFYLMNEKGYSVLSHLILNKKILHINCVISAVDNNVKKDYYEDIKSLCIKENIIYHDRLDSINIESDYQVAVGWRWLIDNPINLIVLHDSILPKYRGFAPLVNSLINGDEEIGVTALLANKEYDSGDILKQKKTSINYPIRIADAIKLLSYIYSELVCEIIENIDTITPYSQCKDQATYSLWRDNEDYLIDWSWSSKKIKRFVDAVGFPYDGAKCIINNNIITVIDVEEVEDVIIENRENGKVIFFKEGLPIVVCENGLLKINRMLDLNKKEFQLKKFRTRFK